MAGFDEEWGKKRATISERCMFMFNNDLLSDVSLVVREASGNSSDSKKKNMAIPAHKFVLSICSPVFFAMFRSEMAEKSESIELHDCEYEGVLEMLRYMYTKEVKLNENNVMLVLYVAKKYILKSLADECVDFLLRNLDVSNVFCVLSHAKQFDENYLADRCWEMIDRETVEVVKSDEFATLERSLLGAMVKRDTLTIPELELFKAVDMWATKECERQGLSTDCGSVKRRILGENIVKSLRFPAMTERDFANIVVSTNIITNIEVKEMMKIFEGVLEGPISFPDSKRIGTCQSCCRFAKFCSHTSHQWFYDKYEFYREGGFCSEDQIQFWVDKDIMLHGIRLFGRKDVAYDEVQIRIFSPEHCRFFHQGSFKSVPLAYKEANVDVYDIWFDPLALKKEKKYYVSANIEGKKSGFGVGGVATVQCQDVTFHFDEVCYDFRKIKCFTRVEEGQFAEFFFTVGQ